MILDAREKSPASLPTWGFQRKVQGKKEFAALTTRLKKRFNETVDERLRRLQPASPEKVPD